MKRARVRSLLIVAAAAGLGNSLAFANPPNSSYRLTFDDEFNGNSLDTIKWNDASPGWTMPNSASTASASEVSVGNGSLTLSATRTSSTAFSSGSVSSYTSYNFTGGYVEGRIQLPTTPGSWPAFWGLYTGWPPEADIMEYPLTTDGGTDGLPDNEYNTNYHYTNSSGVAAAGAGVVNAGTDLAGQWETFGMNWVSNTSVAFYLNGNEVSSYTGSSVSQMAYMYMILDYAVGGWPGTPSLTQWPIGHTDQLNVDYVRVWQSNTSNTTSIWNVNGGGSFQASGNWNGIVPTLGNQIAEFVPVGNAATAAVSVTGPVVTGGMVFGDPNNVTSMNTSYTVGSSGAEISLSNTSGTALVHEVSTCAVNQTIAGQLELLTNTTFDNDSATGTMIIGGTLVGTGALTKTGVGVLEISGANNNFTGTVNVGSGSTSGGDVNGALEITTTGSLAGVTQVNINDNNTANSIFQLDATGANIVLPAATLFSLNANTAGNGTTIAATQVENVAGNNTIEGAWTCNSGGAGYGFQVDAGSLTLEGPFKVTVGSNKTLLRGAGNGAFDGVIGSAGATNFSIDMLGTGTWGLDAPNQFTGSTTINSGTLEIGTAGGLPSGDSVANATNFLVAGNTNAASITDISGTGTAVTTVNTGVTLTASTLTQGSLVNNGSVTITNSGAIKTVTGSGGLTVGNGTSGATLQLTQNGGASAQSSLNILSGATLDITNNRLTINYGSGTDPIASVAAWIASGYAGGAWNGTGIISSLAAGNPAYGVGYGDAADVGDPAHLPPGTIEIEYTLLGDANLDGIVNGIDFGILAANFNKGVTGWDEGDFNYDGVVNGIDFGNLAANFNKGASGQSVGTPALDDPAIVAFAIANGLMADVPEPASLAAIGVASAGLIGGRRVRRRAMT